MSLPSVGILGRYGRFGSKLAQLLKQHFPEIYISGAEGKNHNCEIAGRVDTLVLAVPTEQIAAVLAEIKPALAATTEVISFVSGTPLAVIASSLSVPVAKAMMNQDGTTGMIYQAHKPTRFEPLLKQILWHPLRYATSDRDVDEFTVGLVYLFVVGLWAIDRHSGHASTWSKKHVEFAIESLGFGGEVVQDLLMAVRANRDLQDQLQAKAARGGITGAMVQVLQRQDDAYPLSVYRAGWKRMENYINQKV